VAVTDAERVTIPAGRGAAVRLRAGQHVRVINTRGTQCVDTWAFVADDVAEFLSMEHSRSTLEKIHFEVGDVLATNRYAPLLEIVADTSPGGHDTLIAACTEEMYTRAGRPAGHANCADNLRAALATLGVDAGPTPAPWNLFMLAPVGAGGAIRFTRPTSAPGDYVELAATRDAIVAFSACPDDVYPTNGGDGSPADAHFAVFDPARPS